MASDTLPGLAWERLKADRMTIFEAAQSVAKAHGFGIEDEVHADTGSSYFTVTKVIGGGVLGFRVRISNHHPNGRQVRERCCFVTYHCVRRARRDLKKFIRRLERLDTFT